MPLYRTKDRTAVRAWWYSLKVGDPIALYLDAGRKTQRWVEGRVTRFRDGVADCEPVESSTAVVFGHRVYVRGPGRRNYGYYGMTEADALPPGHPKIAEMERERETMLARKAANERTQRALSWLGYAVSADVLPIDIGQVVAQLVTLVEAERARRDASGGGA